MQTYERIKNNLLNKYCIFVLLCQMSGNKCRNCGSTDIETDPGRGDAICVECGFVLEDSVIISQTTFEESSSGKVMVLGHFVANDSTGSATNFGACKLFKYIIIYIL